MKKLLTLSVLALLISISAQSQNLSSIAIADENPNWITFRNPAQLNPATLFTQHKQAFGLGNNDEMILQKTKSDNLGFTHFRYQQYYKGVPVYGSDYMLHQKNKQLLTANGEIIKGLSLNAAPALSLDDAIQKALAYMNAERYIWQDAQREAMLKQIRNDPAATYYPKAELFVMNKSMNNNPAEYRLVYKLEVYATKPLKREFIFVDAMNGSIYHHLNMLMTDDVPAVAHTRYDGVQNITADSLAPASYRLRETGRGNGIMTYNMLNQDVYANAVDFTDTDNHWGETDSVGTEAHWASEMTYDYYWNTFGRNSYNNAGAQLVSYVHYSTNFANAYWDGSSMTYGDGSGSYSAFTTVDICAHEITHAVSENEANLIYQNEPGALSESFSDIFGTCVEFYADPMPNWACGEDIGDTLRFLNDPKHGSQPDTYLGEFWESDPAVDNGGVHQNCSVGNYWFYLLSMGGSGVNDNFTSYSVNGVTMDTAAAIAYRALNQYIGASSNYYDMYMGTMQAAKDLYGNCSNAVIQCAAAWSAVGIGHPYTDSKVFLLGVDWPVTACGLGNEYPAVSLLYNSCNSDLAPATIIPMAYRIDNNAMVYDTLILAATWNGGDTLHYIFPTSVNLATLGMHTIDVWTKLGDTAVAWNDSIMDVSFESKLQQNFDVGVVGITSPVSGCGLGNAETVKVLISFFGCDSLELDSIMVGYSTGGTPFFEYFVLPHTLFPQDTIEYTFNLPVDLSASGTYTFFALTSNSIDTILSNNMFSGYTVINPIQHQADTITFSEANISDHYYVTSGGWGRAWVATAAANGSGKGLKMTSGNVLNYMGILEFPADTNDIWNVNEFLSAKAHFCVDATAWTTCWVKFDLKQTHGGTLYSQYLGANDYTMASNFRVLVNNTQVSGTFNPTTAGSDPFVTHYINLNSYAGQKFDVNFESRNISADTTIIVIPFVLDNAYLDNVCFAQVYAPGFEDIQSPINSAAAFPNPSQNAFTIACSMTDPAKVSAVLTDMLGRNVWENEFNMTAGQNKFALDLSQYPCGIYNMRLVSDKNVVTLKLIKN
ncbi:MAG: M4 family metallopeptidase [Bacteroidota bacterium]